MGLLRAEAEKLSNNQLEAGVIEEIIDRDALFALFPFMGIMGKAYVYNREATISEGEFIDPVTDEQRRMFDHMVALQDIAFDAMKPNATRDSSSDVSRSVSPDMEACPFV